MGICDCEGGGELSFLCSVLRPGQINARRRLEAGAGVVHKFLDSSLDPEAT